MEKKLERLSRGKNKFIFKFSSAPQIINGRPLTKYEPVQSTVCKVEKSSHLTEDFSIRTRSRHLILDISGILTKLYSFK